MEWLLRIKNALDLMEERMQQPLDIDEIAKAAYSSPFHFQRMFHMLTGVTVAEYVRKRRLTLAAQELSLSSAKVLDVAFKYGYDSPESFSKAFRKVHSISPSEARSPGVNLKAFPRITFHLSLKGDQEMDYKIVEKAAFTECLHPLALCLIRSRMYGKEFFRNGSLLAIMSIQAARSWKCIVWEMLMPKTTEVKFGFRL